MGGQARWVARKPHLFEPEGVTQLLGDLQPVTDTKINPNEEVSKIKEETYGSALAMHRNPANRRAFDEREVALLR